MKSKRLFLAIGNIDDQFINEDAEVIAAPKDRRSERPTFAPWLKLAVPVAACLAIAVGVFVGQSGLFTPHNVSDVVGDVKQIASSEQTRLAPAESSIAPQQHTEAPSIPSTETADVYVGQNGLSAPPDAGGDVKQIASTEQTDLVSTETPFVPQQQTEAPSIPSTETAHLSVININELSEISAARLIIDLKPEDFVPMDKNEIVDYYGIDFFPSTIPADMKIVEEGTYGIYKRDEGAGEVYYSANLAWYVDENVHRQLQVNIDKGKLPHSCFAYLGTEYEKSMINGTELLIGRSVGHSGVENYVAEMMYAGNGLRIESSNLTQTEFVDTVTSLIQNLDEAAQTAETAAESKNADVENPAHQDIQITKVTSEQVSKITADMKYDDIIALLGDTANVGFGRLILQYEIDGDYLLNIAFNSLETPCGYSGEELLAQLIQK